MAATNSAANQKTFHYTTGDYEMIMQDYKNMPARNHKTRERIAKDNARKIGSNWAAQGNAGWDGKLSKHERSAGIGYAIVLSLVVSAAIVAGLVAIFGWAA